jgi:hypothetical protein
MVRRRIAEIAFTGRQGCMPVIHDYLSGRVLCHTGALRMNLLVSGYTTPGRCA